MPKPEPNPAGPATRALVLRRLAGAYCVARLGPKAPLPPGFLEGPGFASATRTEAELSLVYAQSEDISADACVNNWVGFVVEGVLDFSEIGILSRLSGVLAEAGISLYAVSTFDTDYLFIRAEAEQQARAALSKIAKVRV